MYRDAVLPEIYAFLEKCVYYHVIKLWYLKTFGAVQWFSMTKY